MVHIAVVADAIVVVVAVLAVVVHLAQAAVVVDPVNAHAVVARHQPLALVARLCAWRANLVHGVNEAVARAIADVLARASRLSGARRAHANGCRLLLWHRHVSAQVRAGRADDRVHDIAVVVALEVVAGAVETASVDMHAHAAFTVNGALVVSASTNEVQGVHVGSQVRRCNTSRGGSDRERDIARCGVETDAPRVLCR